MLVAIGLGKVLLLTFVRIYIPCKKFYFQTGENYT